MKNMGLEEDIQREVRDFMLRTNSNMDSQEELKKFLKYISPSLQYQVT